MASITFGFAGGGGVVLAVAVTRGWRSAGWGVAAALGGLFVIVALWLSIAWTIREFALVKAAAAWMLAPYLIWVTFASVLNLALWKLNQ